MVVAETLAGLALVNSAVKGIKSVINTCQDVGQIATQIDAVITGTKEVHAKSLDLVRRMINKRFGPDTWREILEERELRIEKHKKEQKKEIAKKQESNEKLYKILETIAGYIFLFVVIAGVGAYIWWARK